MVGTDCPCTSATTLGNRGRRLASDGYSIRNHGNNRLMKPKALAGILNIPSLGQPEDRTGLFGPESTLSRVVSEGCSAIRGGHLIWKHSGRRIRLDRGGPAVLVHRALFESVNGPIPDGAYILNACLIPNCIAPDCWRVTKHARWSDVIRFTHTAPASAIPKAVCSPLPGDGVRCG